MPLESLSLRTRKDLIEKLAKLAEEFNVSKSFIADLALRFALEYKYEEFLNYVRQYIPVALNLGINPKRLKPQQPYRKSY